MKKIRKGKKLLLILLIVIVIALAAVFIVKNVINKVPGGTETPEEPQVVIPLPKITYSDMEVKNIHMEYLKDNNETVVRMEIHNTTENKVVDEDLDAILIGPDGNVLAKIQTYIAGLDVGEQYDMEVVYKGDLTSTQQIKLEKKVNQ